jgi:hypothetical protein
MDSKNVDARIKMLAEWLLAMSKLGTARVGITSVIHSGSRNCTPGQHVNDTQCHKVIPNPPLNMELPVATFWRLRVLCFGHNTAKGIVNQKLLVSRPCELAGLVIVHCNLILPARSSHSSLILTSLRLLWHSSCAMMQETECTTLTITRAKRSGLLYNLKHWCKTNKSIVHLYSWYSISTKDEGCISVRNFHPPSGASNHHLCCSSP